MSKTHKIKLLSRYYDYVESRIKNAEVRFNDRNYLVGDWIVLQEWTGSEYTGFEIVRRINGVFPLNSIGFSGWVLICME